MFTVSVSTTTGPLTLTWDRGVLDGDSELVSLVRQCANSLEGQRVGSVGGPYTVPDHLADPLSALTILLDLLGHGAEIMGYVTVRPPISEDAVR